MTRFCLAMPLMQDAVDAITELQAALPHHLETVPAPNLHMTLRFLGEASTSQIDSLIAEVHELEAAVVTDPVAISGLGAHPSVESAELLLASVPDPPGELTRLQRHLERIAVSVGFAPASRAWHPHVTIARIAAGAPRVSVSAITNPRRNVAFGHVNHARLMLFEIIEEPASHGRFRWRLI